jgi:hypothetical protein
MAGVPTAANFLPHVGTTVSLPDGQTLTLVAVDQPSGGARDTAPRPPFSLLLRGRSTPVVPEGMHRLVFADDAGFELYLIPIHTPSRDHQDYQVVFN